MWSGVAGARVHQDPRYEPVIRRVDAGFLIDTRAPVDRSQRHLLVDRRGVTRKRVGARELAGSSNR
jgi:hypothetical protein